MRASKLTDEIGRLAALDRYEILDTPASEPFDKITALLKSVLSVPIAAVSLIDRERQWFKSIQGLEVSETPRSVSFCTHTIKDDAILIVEDAATDDRFRDNILVTGAPYIRSYAGAPLRTPDGYNIGALCAIDTEARVFSDAQLGILRSFASLVVDEFELRQIAQSDHLTGTLSRRGFVAQIEKEIERYRRGNSRSMLALLDIDHFKSVNDQFGHPAGDAVLQAISKVCTDHLRTNDLFGRLGGEEFGILMTETDEAGGKAAAEKIRHKIEDCMIPHGGGIRVTASFGLSVLHRGIIDADAWLADADTALYSAKRSGRNRCVEVGRQGAASAKQEG